MTPTDNAPTTEQLYDRAGRNWRRTQPTILSDFTARPFLLEMCRPVGDLTVLDLGCGEGYFARHLRQRGAARVHGIDVSGEMVQGAIDQEAEENLGGITYEVRDATDLEHLEGDSFDLVVAVFLFNYLDLAATGRTMQGIHRVLRPGGRFVFAVPHPSLPFLGPDRPPFYFEAGEHGYFSGRDRQLEGMISRRDGDAVPVRCVHKTFTDYFHALGTAGFGSMPVVEELRVTEEHLAAEPQWFGPLRDLPLHVAFRLEK